MDTDLSRSVEKLGERVGEAEKSIAVHEAVCAERYQSFIAQITNLRTESIAQITSLRTESASRAVRQETLIKMWTIGIGTVVGTAMLVLEFWRRSAGLH
jgi:hypothetical protein